MDKEFTAQAGKQNMNKWVCSLVAVLTAMTFSEISLGASATGRVTMLVVKQLTIQNVSDLNFSSASPGRNSQILSPLSNSAGKFSVVGEPKTAVTITLPTEAIITTGQGGEHQSIKITEFQSSVGSNAQLSADGTLTVSIGAKRESLSRQQEIGPYIGQYQLDIIY